MPSLLRGRRFTERGLKRILQIVQKYHHEGRTRISQRICVQLDWRQPNGWLKDRACRDVLRTLEALGVIKLPKKLTAKKSSHPVKLRTVDLPPETEEALLAMPAVLELEFAKGNANEVIWNSLIQKYHYLGHRIQVGRCLKYLIRGDGRIIGAISFSSPAWKLRTRDALLTAIGVNGRNARDRVISNTRFLILPAVRVPHLASRALAMASRQVAKDWLAFYSIEPWVAETFVEPTRFEGTCYRAANWVQIGATRGYAKVGPSHHNSQSPKRVFVYGLTSDYRRRIAAAAQQTSRDDATQLRRTS